MYKILIIDDSVFTLKVLEDILEEEYEVITAISGKEGIALAKQKHPSLILLDIEMPEMDGFEVLKMLKEDRETENIPVIFLTGLMGSAYEEKGFLNGAVDYIVKPYNSNVVKVRVNTHVNLAEYRKKIEKQLNIDTLTEISNRRGLEAYVKKLEERTSEEAFMFNCVLLDIDYFKMVNDTYGHLEGDHVLKQVAAVLRNNVSTEKGYVARYGGEEFALLFPDMQKEQVHMVMNNIFVQMEEAKIPNRKSSVSKFLTVSAGGAGREISRPEEVKEIVKTADEMLYKSKEGGRDKFTWYE